MKNTSIFSIFFKIILLMHLLLIGCEGFDILEHKEKNNLEHAKNTDTDTDTDTKTGKNLDTDSNKKAEEVEEAKETTATTKNLPPKKETVIADTIIKNTEKKEEKQDPVSSAITSDEPEHLETENTKDKQYLYHWESNLLGKQYEFSSGENLLQSVEFLNEQINYSTISASSEILLQKYNLILSDNGSAIWTAELANALLKNIKSIPHFKIKKTKVLLSKQELIKDINKNSLEQSITLSLSAFNYANPKMIKLNGDSGVFFSRRLFKALLIFYTNEGKDTLVINKILKDKFALKINLSNQKIRQLTNEHWDRFQKFKSKELLQIIMGLSETPKALFKISGLSYLLRRRDGHPHPILKEAVAVAYPRGANVKSYIEFMESAFTRGRTKDKIQKTILHEKSHFLWRNIFSNFLKEKWATVGKWYLSEKDSSQWLTKSTTHFVSSYAHLLNPNEDMAESFSFYISNPAKLFSVAKEKYEFIEKYIMKGYKYKTQIRSDLQFKVLNLFPDYIYPGKIKRVDIKALGLKNEDKKITVEIELQKISGYQTGAKYAFMRIFSSNKTFKDLYLHPVKNNFYILRGSFSLSSQAKSGYWITEQITLTDQVGNKRYEDSDDYGFKIFINNQKEDIINPEYIKKSMRLSVDPVIKESRTLSKVTATWAIKENRDLQENAAYAKLSFLGKDRIYSLKKWGTINNTSKTASVDFFINEYFPTGKYGISYIKMMDKALNFGEQYFSKSPKDEKITSVKISPSNRDNKAPELNVNTINISAVPKDRQNLNGETIVKLKIKIRDNKSGVGKVSFYLIDPTGKRHSYYFYNTNTYTLFFKGSPTKWKENSISITLPKGSAAGTWGLHEVYLEDKAGNFTTYNFSEIIHFKLQ